VIELPTWRIGTFPDRPCLPRSALAIWRQGKSGLELLGLLAREGASVLA
jgi:hypothetical protein